MNGSNITKVGQKAKCETEFFINCYLDDQAKGWPLIRSPWVGRSGSVEEKEFHLDRCFSGLADRAAYLSLDRPPNCTA